VAPSAYSLISGYIVYIDDGLDGDFSIGYDGRTNPSLVSTKIAGLVPRSIYRIKVAAVNKAGVGSISDETTCYTVAIPGQPGRPELVSSSDNFIEVRWGPAFDDGGSPIKEYELQTEAVEGLGVANIESW
jgi:hypothetical protein